MKGSKLVRRVVVSADGQGVVSAAGVGLLREMAEYTGLVEAVSEAVSRPTGVSRCMRRADEICGIAVLTDRQELFGAVPSMPTTWWMLDRVEGQHLDAVRDARGAPRAAALGAGAFPDLDAELCLDFDATNTIAHSEKENAAATWKHTFGFHPLLCFLDRPEVAGGEALAGLLRKGNAGSNTATDHIEVLDMALAALPERARPRPGDPEGPRLLARSDSAGATHAFATACAERGVGFSFGFPVDARIQQNVDAIPEQCWHAAIQTNGEFRDGARVAEATGMINLDTWPKGTRLILRKERPHPGAQLTFTDVDGHRVTAIVTNTAAGLVPNQVAGLKLRHRQHARVEDRIRQAKATGLRNFPCRPAQRTRPGPGQPRRRVASHPPIHRPPRRLSPLRTLTPATAAG